MKRISYKTDQNNPAVKKYVKAMKRGINKVLKRHFLECAKYAVVFLEDFKIFKDTYRLNGVRYEITYRKVKERK